MPQEFSRKSSWKSGRESRSAAVVVPQHAGQLHTTGGELQHKQQIEGNEPSLGPDLDGGEIDRGQNIPMGFQECMPCGLSFSFRRGFDAAFSEGVTNG